VFPAADAATTAAVKVDGQISATYDDFLAVVAKGRSMTKEAVRQVAKGQVWSGSQAMEVRLQHGHVAFLASSSGSFKQTHDMTTEAH
jgi:ClpP class serine protease